MDLITQLQHSNQTLRKELQLTKKQVAELEQQVKHNTDTQAKQIEAATHEITSKVTAPPENVVQEVLAQLKEKDEQEAIETYIRVGGIAEDWQEVEVLEAEEIEQDTYVPEYEILARKICRAIPFVDIGDPFAVLPKGKHVILKYSKLHEKIKVMKQARSLQGTKVWMADELTPAQIKNRKEELAKVYEARKQGKWAVYRRGIAVIEEFRKPKVDKG